MVVVDADELFIGVFRKTFEETLLMRVHAVGRGNQKSIVNEGFHCYLKKIHKLNLAYKVSLRLWLQGLFFALYAWNSVPVDGTDISESVVFFERELPVSIELS